MIRLKDVAFQPSVGAGNVIQGVIEFQASLEILDKVFAPAIMQELVKRLGCKSIGELKKKIEAWKSVDEPAVRKDPVIEKIQKDGELHNHLHQQKTIGNYSDYC